MHIDLHIFSVIRDVFDNILDILHHLFILKDVVMVKLLKRLGKNWFSLFVRPNFTNFQGSDIYCTIPIPTFSDWFFIFRKVFIDQLLSCWHSMTIDTIKLNSRWGQLFNNSSPFVPYIMTHSLNFQMIKSCRCFLKHV